MQILGEKITARSLFDATYLEKSKFELSKDAVAKMQKSRAYIESRIEKGDVMYGVNTGFGVFSNVHIAPDKIAVLQKNIVRSHSAGIGTPFTKEESKAMMILRANALARGHSGIRPVIVEKILEFLNQDLIPVIPSQGSVGASGDLAPLSHLALALIGEGQVWQNGAAVDVAPLLKQKGIQPLELKAKEGLSLINGCQVMTALGMIVAARARELLILADVAGCMSLEALRGSRKAFLPIISAARPHVGEIKTARNLMKILGPSSEIGESHVDCEKVQDAYSLRCMPAVHGATKDTLRNTLSVLEVEANSSTDNPLVFADEDQILSCGNFHGEPVALALDFLGIALASMANISECRMAKLTNGAMSGGLPTHLIKEGGLNSGHMMVHVAAAALVSENKILAHPASVDSIPTNADKEDHVSMGTIAARKCKSILENATQVLAMEFLSASQGLGLLAPLKTSPVLQKVYEQIREKVPFAEQDRIFYKDVQAIHELIVSGKLFRTVTDSIGDLEC